MRSKEPAKKRTSPAVSRSLNWRELSCGKRLPREESIENGHHSRERFAGAWIRRSGMVPLFRGRDKLKAAAGRTAKMAT